MRLFWKSSRAKRAAISTIAPLVELSRSQIGTIQDQLWRQPYMIGFLSTLITLTALRNGELDSEQMGLTQLEAWAAITGLQDDQIGEDIQLLSADADAHFLVGCTNAAVFYRVLNGETPVENFRDFSAAPTQASAWFTPFGFNDKPSFGKGGEFAEALWVEFFNEHVKI